MGLIVNRLVGQQEVAIKSLGNYLSDIPGIVGTTILGDGHVALIIDPMALSKVCE
jgi:two-component system chemotaxis sensor kinase CheA